MADGLELNAGSGGSTLATDDVGGNHYQIVKVAIGALDAAVLAIAGAGNVTTGTLRVTLADDDTNAAAIKAALETAGGLVVNLGANNDVTVTGTVDLGAVDNAVLDAIAAALAGTLTVGSHAVTNAGTFAVQAAQSGTWNVTNVSGTVSLPTGAATAAKQPALGTAGSSSTDVLSVQGIASGTALPVSLASVPSHAVTNAGTFATQATLQTGSNAIGKLAANSGVDIGDVDVTSISAGSNLIGNVGVGVRTSGGMSIFKSIDIDETEEEVKATAGQVYSITAFNHTAAPIFLKFYNATAANVSVGTTVPVLTFTVPANADSDGAGFVWNNPIGFAFSTAISVAATTAIADNDTGAPAGNACSVMIGYA